MNSGRLHETLRTLGIVSIAEIRLFNHRHGVVSHVFGAMDHRAFVVGRCRIRSGSGLLSHPAITLGDASGVAVSSVGVRDSDGSMGEDGYRAD